MSKKILKIVGLILLFAFSLVYMYKYRTLVDDEIYGFGFGVNVLNGLVPYRDFNMIITPMFSYIVALFLMIFGKHFIIYHILISLMIIGITVLSYKKIGYSAIAIYFLLLIYPFTGYNMFGLLLLFLLINLDSDKKSYLVLEVIIISMMILTKQVLGLLVLPSLIYSKNKSKSFLIYLGVCLLFILGLVYNGCLYEFFDYCLFGMFDFSKQNNEGINFFLILEILIIGYLIYISVKKKDKNLFYILCFQIMCFPIVNYPHFMISFIPFVYYLLSYKKKYINLMGSIFVVIYFVIFSISLMMVDDKYLYTSISHEDNFYKGKMVASHFDFMIDSISDVIERHDGYRYYLLGNFAYLVKLELGEKIDKFDLINNGNMGYNGEYRYIDEIDNYCKKNNNKCLFIVESKDENSTNQTNVEILKYVQDSYIKEISSNIFEIYIN